MQRRKTADPFLDLVAEMEKANRLLLQRLRKIDATFQARLRKLELGED